MNERGVELRPYPLEDHAEEVLVGLQDALLHGKPLHMLHPVNLPEHGEHGVAHLNGVLLACLQRHEVAHLNVTAEPHHLVSDGVLEAKHHTHRHNHHRQADSHTSGSYAYSRLRDHALAIVVTVDSLGNE